MSDDISQLKTQLRDTQHKMRTAEGALADAKRDRVRWSIWSAVGGFLLFAIGGQWFPGYQLDSTAIKTSQASAANAASNVMAELCAERFMRASGFESRLAGLKDANGNWSKANYIREGAWANAPDGVKADHATAERCVELIAERVSNMSESAS